MIRDRLRTAVAVFLLTVASAVEAQWTAPPRPHPESGQRGVGVLTSQPKGAATQSVGGSYI